MEVSITDLLFDLVGKISLVIVVAYLVTRSRYFAEILDKQFNFKNQAILILIFGAFSIFGTYSGIKLPSGAIANIRDLGPMIAGLIGGPVVGLGAGLIGGTHRYFLGGLTCVPCSLATVIAGLAGGIGNQEASEGAAPIRRPADIGRAKELDTDQSCGKDAAPRRLP